MSAMRTDKRPENYYADAEQQRLADNPEKAQAAASIARRHFAHHQRANDLGLPDDKRTAHGWCDVIFYAKRMAASPAHSSRADDANISAPERDAKALRAGLNPRGSAAPDRRPGR